jgi:Holliday junction resolvase RusA-like endonuclease
MTWARAKANFRGGKPHYFTAPDREAKMGEIALLWQAAGHGLLEGPLALECEFIFPRPKSHFKDAEKQNAIKEKYALARPGRGKFGGDIDNLVKIVQDALNTVAYDDDSQIAELRAIKRYAIGDEIPETRVSLQPLEEAPISADQLSL